MSTVIVIPQDILESFTRPALDLLTGQIIELSPDPAQLPLFEQEETSCVH